MENQRISDLATELKNLISKTEDDFNILFERPDPDSMGSALGMDLIFRSLGRKSHIYYFGQPTRRQNISIFSKHNLARKMTPSSKLDLENPVANIVLVDSHIVPAQVKNKDALIIIDHHGTGLPEKEGVFHWIEDGKNRNGVGSCSTMIIELIKEMNILNSEKIPDEEKTVALMLVLGIHTDTRKFISSSKRDLDAFGYFNNRLEEKELGKLFHYSKPKSHYDNQARACQGYKCKGSKLVASVGIINNPQDADDIAIFANDFIDMEAISLAVVWGIVMHNGVKEVRIRFRSESDFPVLLDEFIRERFGTGGGKETPDGRSEGGADINLDPLKNWLRSETEEETKNLVGKYIETLVFQD